MVKLPLITWKALASALCAGNCENLCYSFKNIADALLWQVILTKLLISFTARHLCNNFHPIDNLLNGPCDFVKYILCNNF